MESAFLNFCKNRCHGLPLISTTTANNTLNNDDEPMHSTTSDTPSTVVSSDAIFSYGAILSSTSSLSSATHTSDATMVTESMDSPNGAWIALKYLFASLSLMLSDITVSVTPFNRDTLRWLLLGPMHTRYWKINELFKLALAINTRMILRSIFINATFYAHVQCFSDIKLYCPHCLFEL